MPESTFNDSLRQAGNEILDQIGITAVSRYVRQGEGEPVPDLLTNRLGRLAKALKGNEYRRIEFTPGQAHFIMDLSPLKREYSIHEAGGIRSITERMRKFFWAKYYETSLDKWRALAIKKGDLVFPARPFMEPAFKDNLQFASETIRKYVGHTLEAELNRIIDDARNT